MSSQEQLVATEALLKRRWEELGYKNLTYSEQKYIALWWLCGDVMNGGFHQYFFNSSGNLALEALAGLSEIGADQTELILRRALACFGAEGYIADQRKRQLRLTAMADSLFDELDQQFFDYPEDIDSLALAFLAREYVRMGLLTDRR